ncbi:hypothetical protein THAOC_36323, partial [Thalassiosira oceanica]
FKINRLEYGFEAMNKFSFDRC